MFGRNCITCVQLEISLEALTPLLPFQKGECEKACAGEEGFSTQILNFVLLTKHYENLLQKVFEWLCHGDLEALWRQFRVCQ